MEQNPEHAFYPAMARFQRLYSKALSKRLDPHGVKPGYLEVFFRLWERDGISQKRLHAQLDVEQATLSNTLKRMERDGFVKRTPNRKDRRQSIIVLTETGSGLRKLVLAAVDDLQSIVNQGLTINDKRYFRRILKQMTEYLEDDIGDGALVLLDEVDSDDESPLILTDKVMG